MFDEKYTTGVTHLFKNTNNKAVDESISFYAKPSSKESNKLVMQIAF